MEKIILPVILYAVLRICQFFNRISLNNKGVAIESGLWRVAKGALFFWIIGDLADAYLTTHINRLNYKHFHLITWIVVTAVFFGCIYISDGNWVAQFQRLGYRLRYASGPGPTFRIPGIDVVVPVNIGKNDFEMGGKSTNSPHDFILTARDSEANRDNPGYTEELPDLDAIRTEVGAEMEQIKENAGKAKKGEKGYNNLKVIVQVIHRTISPIQYLGVVPDDGNDIDRQVESRLARLVASIIRNYCIRLTDEFVIEHQRLIEAWVCDDLQPVCTLGARKEQPGPYWEQVKELGQLVMFVNVREADYASDEIKNARAQIRTEISKAAANMTGARGLVERHNYVTANLRGSDGVSKVTIDSATLIDALQAEDKKAIKIIGGNMAASMGLLHGSGPELIKRLDSEGAAGEKQDKPAPSEPNET